MSSVTIQLKTSRQFGNLANLTSGYKDPNHVAKAAAHLVERWAEGVDSGEIQVSIASADPVAAAATVTITHANLANNDPITVCRQVLTAKTSGADGTTQFNIGADATADAVSLKNCINANTTLSKYVVATSALGVVTVTAKLKGAWGNLMSISSSDNAFAIVDFASGTGGFDTAPVTYSK